MTRAYQDGEPGSVVDPLLFIHYARFAYFNRYPDSDLLLSYFFHCGLDGVLDRNPGFAYHCGRQAAKRGLVEAMFTVDIYHETGIGVPKDLAEARNWYEKAAAKGHRKAEKRLAALS
jgi:TPR repeat protein